MGSRYSDDNASLVRRLRQGDVKSFELIFNKYKEKLYYFVLGYVHSPQETEEILQNLFIALWENRQNLNEDQSVKSYLYKAVINKVYNYFKHEAVQKKYFEHLSRQFRDEEDQLLKALYYDELKDSIKSLVESLPERQRLIFRLSRNLGLSHQEIADYLGLSVRSIENQVYRALKCLKENLGEEHLLSRAVKQNDL